MQDVADRAGVSRTTVSFILNQKPNVNIPKDTQRRVLEAVEALGYRPNAIARGLPVTKNLHHRFHLRCGRNNPICGEDAAGCSRFRVGAQ